MRSIAGIRRLFPSGRRSKWTAAGGTGNVEDLPWDQAGVDEYLGHIRPAIALLIEGPWGSGKTYFLRNRVERICSAKGKKFAMFSAAGLKTREELEQALFLAASPYLKSGYIGALGVFARAGLRWARIEPNDIKPTADLRPGRIVIAIDDAERFVGDLRTLLGLAIDLVDQHGIHLVLAGFEEKINDPAFREWREKVVGRTIRIAPEPEFILRTVLAEMSDRAIAESLDRQFSHLALIIRSWGLANFRAAKYALLDVARALRAVDPRLDAPPERVEAFVTGLLIGALEVRRGERAASVVAEVFSHSDLGMAYQGQLLAQADDDEEKSVIRELYERYSGTRFGEFQGAPAISAYLESGVIQAPDLTSAFEQLIVTEPLRERLLSDYLSLPQAEFDTELASLVADLQASRITSLEAVAKAYISLDYLARHDVIEFTEAAILDMCISSIAGIDAGVVSDPEGDDSVYWYMRDQTAGMKAVQDAITKKRSDARDAQMDTDRRLLIESMQNPNGEFVRRIQEWKGRPLFVAGLEGFVDGLRNLTPNQLQDVLRLFGARRRFSDFSEKLKPEKRVLTGIADALEHNLPRTGKLTIHQSQLKKVAREMRDFAGAIAG